jgi:G3E family GTPase
MPVAETFTFADEQGTSLSDVAQLDTMVRVVDGLNFLRDDGSQDLTDGSGLAALSAKPESALDSCLRLDGHAL